MKKSTEWVLFLTLNFTILGLAYLTAFQELIVAKRILTAFIWLFFIAGIGYVYDQKNLIRIYLKYGKFHTYLSIAFDAIVLLVLIGIGSYLGYLLLIKVLIVGAIIFDYEIKLKAERDEQNEEIL